MGDELKERVRERYADAARAVWGGSAETSCCEPSCCGPDRGAPLRNAGEVVGGVSCCGPSCCGSDGEAVVGTEMTDGAYSEIAEGELPRLAAKASLGCGNPVALADLSPGEVLLDLGSGGGIDVLLSARRVAPDGRAYGLDMTDEMLALARENRKEAGVENAEFLKGEIEDVPLPDGHVDVVISNCVVNLSTDKPRALGEAFRVLKPGGRFAVSDVVFLGKKAKLPAGVARSAELWSGCVTGALEKAEYEALLREAGFEDVSVEVTHTYHTRVELDDPGDIEALRQVPIVSAFVRARKPEK